LGVKGESHPPKFFRENAFFSSGRSKKRIFRKKFGGITPTPTPKIFSFSKIGFLDGNVFLYGQTYFLSEKFEFFKSGGLTVFCPHRRI